MPTALFCALVILACFGVFYLTLDARGRIMPRPASPQIPAPRPEPEYLPKAHDTCSVDHFHFGPIDFVMTDSGFSGPIFLTREGYGLWELAGRPKLDPERLARRGTTGLLFEGGPIRLTPTFERLAGR